MTTLHLSLGLVIGLMLAAKLLASRARESKKRAYQQFLHEDRMTSTLEYTREVTRQRRDTRIWR